jgi:hypothetical protein
MAKATPQRDYYYYYIGIRRCSTLRSKTSSEGSQAAGASVVQEAGAPSTCAVERQSAQVHAESNKDSANPPIDEQGNDGATCYNTEAQARCGRRATIVIWVGLRAALM